MKGFSRRNLYRMKQFYAFYADRDEFVPQLVAQIPWGHNDLIIQKIKEKEKALWYVRKTIENGWSRNVLAHQIDSQLYERQAGKTGDPTDRLAAGPIIPLKCCWTDWTVTSPESEGGGRSFIRTAFYLALCLSSFGAFVLSIFLPVFFKIRLWRDGDLLKRFTALMTADLDGYFQIELVQETD